MNTSVRPRSSLRSLSSEAVLNPTPTVTWCVVPVIQLIASAAIAALIGAPWVYLLAVVIVASRLLLPRLIRLRLAARTTNMAATPSQPVRSEREEVIRRMSPEASAIITAAAEALRARYNAPEIQTEFYVCRCQDPARYKCRCGVIRLAASILLHSANRGWPILVVGDLLTASPDQLRFVLAHELQHHTRPHRMFLRGRALFNQLLWLLLGLLTPLAYLPAIAVAAWTALMASAWIEEVICDVAAARRYSGASWCKAALDAQRRAPLLPYLPLPPLHPPLTVRARYILRISCRRT